MAQMQRKLGIIAGDGSLPRELIDACLRQKRPVYLLALKGHADPTLLSKVDGSMLRLGAVGRCIRLLKKNGVQDLVFIGGVRRPSVSEIIPDFKAFMMLARVGFRLGGDDSLLKTLIAEMEQNGFQVVGVDSLVPELLAPEGIYGSIRPDKDDLADIERGITVAKALGQVDVGQATIVQHGLVLSVEGIEGTSELIKRTAKLKRRGGGGVLVKVAKPQQDHRVDLPAIGPQTVQSVFDSGLKGIAVEKGAALLAEADETIALADKLGIFVMGVTCPD